MPDAPVVLWIRHDLRLTDHPAFHAAAQLNLPIYPVFIWSPDEEGDWSPGSAHKWWLHYALEAFQAALKKQGLPLILRKGASLEEIQQLCEETGADTVYWNARYEPSGQQVDADVLHELSESGITVKTFESQLLHNPDAIKTGSGNHYQVFTPFWKKLQEEMQVESPLPVPDISDQHIPESPLSSLSVAALNLLPSIDWAAGLRETWKPGEAQAKKRLELFIDQSLKSYPEQRDYPYDDGTSLMSPYLHHGEISPRTIWHFVREKGASHQDAATSYLREIAWREFSYHLIHHFPETPIKNLKSKFDAFPWSSDEAALEKWQKGKTGYPIVDAGMRQLWHTGWMHNRVRMIVASFLTKHLLLPWQEGARWFWDTLVDGNLANNTMGWQWSAGSGADAQPFFRIFNPITQGERYDPEGAYVRRWIPELEAVPDKYIHKPWAMPEEVLRQSGVKLGETYPSPIVEHKEARKRALDAFESL